MVAVPSYEFLTLRIASISAHNTTYIIIFHYCWCCCFVFCCRYYYYYYYYSIKSSLLLSVICLLLFICFLIVLLNAVKSSFVALSSVKILSFGCLVYLFIFINIFG